jgi:hypothetical protein
VIASRVVLPDDTLLFPLGPRLHQLLPEAADLLDGPLLGLVGRVGIAPFILRDGQNLFEAGAQLRVLCEPCGQMAGAQHFIVVLSHNHLILKDESDYDRVTLLLRFALALAL